MILDLIHRPVWRFLASVRLLIGLLAGFVALCIVGAFIPQDLTPQELIARYGPLKASLLQRFGFSDIFHSGYLALLLLGLSVNVIACTTRRLLLKAMRGVRLVGYLTLHTALIILFVGGTVSALGEKKGFLQVWEGKSEIRYWSWRDSGWRELPFALALDQFSVERYEDLDPPTILSAIPEESYTQEFPADLKKTFKVGTASYWVTPLRFLPDFTLDLETGKAFARSDEPRNPAILVEIQGPLGTERRWLLAHHPQLEVPKDRRLKLLFDFKPLQVKQYVSKVRILEQGQPVRNAIVQVNRPLRYKGWRIYQTSFDPQEHRWSGFQISNDPGIKIVAPGFFLLMTGVILMLGVGPLLERPQDKAGENAAA